VCRRHRRNSRDHLVGEVLDAVAVGGDEVEGATHVADVQVGRVEGGVGPAGADDGDVAADYEGRETEVSGGER
jgi:hypothetical protein